MRRIWILDLTLLALLIAIATRVHNDWIMFNATHQPGAIEPEREQFGKFPSNLPSNAPAPVNWTDIPSHNPFSFDRTDIAILEPKAPPPPAVKLGPKPVLYGTMSIGTDLMAMVGSTKPGSQKSMKVGEVIDGWTIVSIGDKTMVVKGNDAQETIVMNDPTVAIPRDHSRTSDAAPPNIVSISAPPPAAPQPAAMPQPAAPIQQPQQPGQRRRVQQVTPFGIREIEE
jgi:hypothetical protein